MRSVFRIIGLCPLALALAGCRGPRMWADLSAPAEWRELDAEPVVVATAEKASKIVVADDPKAKAAAKFLAETIEEMTGCRPPVYIDCPERPAALKEGLFIGAVRENDGWTCDLSRKNREAFRVVAKDGCVRFLGRADYAVYDWCEREFGMRYYGKGLKCVDRRAQVIARAVDYSDRPTYEVRELWGNAGTWARVSKTGKSHRGGVSVHQPHRWYTNETLKAERPGIFESGETPMLCYGNPETLAYYKFRIDRHIAGVEDSGGIVDTNRKVVTVCQWDAPIKCQCEHCRALYDNSLGKNGEASPIIWGRFMKELSGWLKTAHPDYMISFLPYLNTCEVPRRGQREEGVGKREKERGMWNLDWGVKEVFGGRKAGPRKWRRECRTGNAEAEVCTMSGLALMKDADCKAKEERILRDWYRATGRKVLNWNYGCWPQEWTSAPYVFGQTIREHYEDMEDVLCGAFICGGATDARLQLSMYVWLRCLWNSDVDVEAIYDEFAKRLFGSAAKPMRELIALQETCWNRPWEDGGCTYRNIFEVSYPRKDVARMEALLKDAERVAVAAGDVCAVSNVQWYASGFSTFLKESETLAARTGRPVICPGMTNATVNARWVWNPKTWAKTDVTTSVTGGILRLRVRCFDPAAAKMDFTKAEDNFVWGVDRVTFVFDIDGETRKASVDLAGGVNGGWDGFVASVSHDDRSWTVQAEVKLSAQAIGCGKLLGNVSRWRVGDRRKPEAERVPGSRYEHSRLNTCYTVGDDDPAAFVEFRFEP